jgi:hypothetical protein
MLQDGSPGLAAAISLCPPPAGPAIDPDASETTNVFCPSL